MTAIDNSLFYAQKVKWSNKQAKGEVEFAMITLAYVSRIHSFSMKITKLYRHFFLNSDFFSLVLHIAQIRGLLSCASKCPN